MEKALTVTDANQYIARMFQNDFMLSKIEIKGEVSGCKYHSTGHIYFTLKDAESKISAVMFANSRLRGLKSDIKDGDEVVVSGRIGVYTKAGSYQIYASKIELCGKGDLYQKFLELKAQLEEKGMFCEQYKIPIPKYARRIGIVTAQSGAVIQDIKKVSYRRNPYVQLILYPSAVQGEGAANNIAEGIEYFNNSNVDVVIVGRGGGSIEDLWAFNEMIVAEAIFNCTKPVISAVGHQTDFTIADFVADLRAATPSEAAETAVFDLNQFYTGLENIKSDYQSRMNIALQRVRAKYDNLLMNMKMHDATHLIADKKMRLQELYDGLNAQFGRQLDEVKKQLAVMAASYEGISPLKRLTGGYAYVSDEEGNGIFSVNDLKVSDDLNIRMKDGTVRAKVSKIQTLDGE